MSLLRAVKEEEVLRSQEQVMSKCIVESKTRVVFLWCHIITNDIFDYVYEYQVHKKYVNSR